MSITVSNVSTTAAPAPVAAPASTPASTSRVTLIDDRNASVKDKRGRIIKVKRLGAYDRLKLLRAVGAEHSENRAVLQYALLAAATTEIAGDPIVFPLSNAQIDVIVGRLDDEGLEAVILALAALAPASDEDTIALAKN